MNAKDLMNNLDAISLKDFVDNYDYIKSTLSKLKQKIKEVDGKYNFERLTADQIPGVLHEFKEVIHILK